MDLRMKVVVPALVVLWASPAAAQPAGDAASREALLKTDKEWAQAAATGDVEKIVGYWTEDAVIYSPGEAPVQGKAAIRQYVGGSLKTPGFAITWTPMAAEVSKSGDLGYTTGTNAITIPKAEGTGTTTLAGRYVTVWRKTGDGQWRCVVDAWTPAASPSAPSRP
jgi:uncharacterized protein (TIGR02246 family)